MKKPSQKRPALKYLTALMMLSLLTTPAPAAPSIEDAEALLPAWKESYTRGEVSHLILRLWKIAEEEMASTALEAAADEAAHRALVEALNQDLTAQARELTEETRRIGRQKDRYKTLFLVTGGLALGTTALAALTLILK